MKLWMERLNSHRRTGLANGNHYLWNVFKEYLQTLEMFSGNIWIKGTVTDLRFNQKIEDLEFLPEGQSKLSPPVYALKWYPQTLDQSSIFDSLAPLQTSYQQTVSKDTPYITVIDIGRCTILEMEMEQGPTPLYKKQILKVGTPILKHWWWQWPAQQALLVKLLKNKKQTPLYIYFFRKYQTFVIHHSKPPE